MSERFETFPDTRGLLLPIELADVPFEVARVFVVVGPPEGTTRGGHVVTCRELVVLVDGAAEVRHDGVTTVLDRPGAAVVLTPGGTVDYDLAPGGSTVLVLADEPYRDEP